MAKNAMDIDTKKLEFVALLLSRDENILRYNEEARRQKVREAILVFDAVMEELGNNTPEARKDNGQIGRCNWCAHTNTSVAEYPCASCFDTDEHPNWEPKV